MNKSSSADSGSFTPSLRYEKWEIHTVFPHFPYLVWRQNLSLPVLADLIRASLTVQTDAKSQKYLLIRFPQSVLHTHPSHCTAIRQPTDNPPRPIESCQNVQARVCLPNPHWNTIRHSREKWLTKGKQPQPNRSASFRIRPVTAQP